jgi:KaiC/GvpD/RAD55 family RecA-like ATPase
MRMIVVDGLNLLDQDERAKLELNRVVMRLRRLAVVGILVYEPSEPKYETVDFQADLVISLRGEEYTGTTKYYLHHLSIAKSRFQQTGLGWHQYKIRTSTGINVFPSLHFRVQKSSQDRDAEDELMTPFVTKGAHRDGRLDPRPVHTDDGSILTYLLKAENLRRGSCTVVLGPRRTWKTQLTLDFLRAGSRKKEPGLLLSLLDNQGTIMNQRGCLCGVDCVKNEPCSGNVNCYRNVYLKHLRPGCLAPSEFFHILEQILTSRSGDERIRRLVFWDLTQLEDRFPLLASEGMFVPALMDYLKNSRDPKDDDRPRQITSVFMGAPNTDLAKAASAMADNVVFCWRDTYYKDPTTKAEGIAFHVDRIEGQPGRQELFFLEQRDDKEAVPRLRQRPEPCPKEQLDYAESMIEAIRNLQSLPAQKRIVSARLTAAAAQEALGAAGPQRFSESSARTSSTIVGMTAAISGESSSP